MEQVGQFICCGCRIEHIYPQNMILCAYYSKELTYLSHNWCPGNLCQCSHKCSGSSPLCTTPHCHRGCCCSASAAPGCRSCSHQWHSESQPGAGHPDSSHRWRGRARSPHSHSWAAPSRPLVAGWGRTSALAGRLGTCRCRGPGSRCPQGNWMACCDCWLR